MIDSGGLLLDQGVVLASDAHTEPSKLFLIYAADNFIETSRKRPISRLVQLSMASSFSTG